MLRQPLHGLGLVAGEHMELDAERLQGCDGFRRAFAQGFGHVEAGDPTLFISQMHRTGFAGRAGEAIPAEPRRSEPHASTLDEPLHASARVLLRIHGRGPVACRRRNRPGHRME
jgi:hypothetical protein